MINGLRELDDYLNEVSYGPRVGYQPSKFSLKFINFIKMVGVGESDSSPEVHLVMLDGLAGTKENIANLCHRGLGKTVLFGEYLNLYLGVFGDIDGFGRVNGMLYVSDAMDNGVKNFRSNVETKYNQSPFLQYWIPEANFTENFIEYKRRDGTQFGTRMYGAQSGIRGTKIYGDRPQLVVMDDLIKSDEDAASPAVMGKIRNSIYKGIIPALDPKRRKIILNGTPFNKSDIMCEAVESGSYHVNVWPVCETWPCKEEDFRSSWPDRFTYEAVKKTSDLIKGAFDQEMMLRLTSDEERLVTDDQIKLYNYREWMATRPAFTVYTTTDFAVTEEKKNDFNVVANWAVDFEGNFRFIGGYCRRQLMDKTVDQIFESAEKYPSALMGVGVEVQGQQGGFVSWIVKEMTTRSLFFNLLSHGNGLKPGIRVISSKLQRMNEVVPLIKAGKIMIPDDMADHPWVIEFWNEIKLATKKGLKAKHDDVLDTVSMLYLITPILPAQQFDIPVDSEMDNLSEGQYALGNYLA